MGRREDRAELAKDVTRHVLKLPSVPRSTEKLLDGIQDGLSRDELLAVVKDDPGLCAELLRLQACMHPQGCERIDSIEKAVERVGIESLAAVACASSIQNALRGDVRHGHLLDEYFHHSREIAQTCPILAEVIGLQQRQREFYQMAGLLHDIGRLVMVLAADTETRSNPFCRTFRRSERFHRRNHLANTAA